MPLNNKTRAHLNVKKGNLEDLTIKISPKLNEKQKLALIQLTDFTNDTRTVLFGGGANGGKTYLGSLFLVLNALKYPGTRHLLGGRELKKLKHTTLKTLFGEVMPNLRLEDGIDFKYSELKSEIKFKNGSEILIVDLADRPNDPSCDYLGGMEFFSGFCDEVSRLSENTINIVQTRIRHKHNFYCKCGTPTFGMRVMKTNPDTEMPIEWYCHKCEKRTKGITPKLLLTCNPSRGWLFNEYYKKWKDGTLESSKAFIQSLTSDNIFGTDEYRKTLERMPKHTRDRLLYGSWEYQDDLNMFDDEKLAEMFEFLDLPQLAPPSNEKEVDHQGFINEKKYVMSIDCARLGDDKTCILVWDDFTIVYFKELNKMKLTEQIPVIQSIQAKYKIKNKDIVADSDGVGGGLVDLLPDCQPIINNSKPLDSENYQNLKTQLYFKLAEYVNSGKIRVRFENDVDKESFRNRLTQELQVLKRVNADWDGKVKMTSKDEVKKQISRSPDISDSCAFRMYWAIESSDWGYSFAIA